MAHTFTQHSFAKLQRLLQPLDLQVIHPRTIQQCRRLTQRHADPRDKRKQRWVLADRGWGEVASYCQKMAGYLGVSAGVGEG